MNDLVKTESSRELALYFKESGLFPDLATEAQAFVKIVAGRELGLGPLASVTGLNVIKGRVTFSANLLASMVKRHPRYDYRVLDHSDRSCQIAFFESGEQIGVSTFTVEDAGRAGLRGPSWERYPRAMLFARALTQGVRWYCPDVTAGAPAYSPEELEEETVEAEVVAPPVIDEDPMLELAAQVEDYEFDAEQRTAIRNFVRAGGPEAVDTALSLLREGNPSALFAGMGYEAEATA